MRKLRKLRVRSHELETLMRFVGDDEYIKPRKFSVRYCTTEYYINIRLNGKELDGMSEFCKREGIQVLIEDRCYRNL